MKTPQLENLLEAAIYAALQDNNMPASHIARSMIELQKLAAQLHKRYEAECSYQWADTDKYRKRTETLETKASELAALLGISLGLQRDPRGWPIILAFGNREIRLG